MSDNLPTIDEVLGEFWREALTAGNDTIEAAQLYYVDCRDDAKAHLERLIAAERLDELQKSGTINVMDWPRYKANRITQLTHQANGKEL